MTAAERAAWAAAGALATLAALAGMAVAWGRAVERNEAYGTWQEQPDRYAGMTPVERATARLNDDDAELDHLERDRWLRDVARTARVNWHRETRQVGPPLRVEPYRPERTT